MKDFLTKLAEEFAPEEGEELTPSMAESLMAEDPELAAAATQQASAPVLGQGESRMVTASPETEAAQQEQVLGAKQTAEQIMGNIAEPPPSFPERRTVVEKKTVVEPVDPSQASSKASKEAPPAASEKEPKEEPTQEKKAFWAGFGKKAAALKKQVMKSDITNSFRPTVVVVWNPEQEGSKRMVQNLDRALQSVSGYERAKFLALNGMSDRQTVTELGLTSPSVALFRQGKLVGKVSGNVQSNDLMKFLTEFRGKMA